MKKILMHLSVIALAIVGFSLMPSAALAQSPAEQIQKGVDTAAGDTTGAPDLGDTIETFVNWFSIIVGAVAVIMIIYGGFRYVTSAGNDSAVQAAKSTIVYAIIGLIVVALAQVIVKLVLNAI